MEPHPPRDYFISREDPQSTADKLRNAAARIQVLRGIIHRNEENNTGKPFVHEEPLNKRDTADSRVAIKQKAECKPREEIKIAGNKSSTRRGGRYEMRVREQGCIGYN